MCGQRRGYLCQPFRRDVVEGGPSERPSWPRKDSCHSLERVNHSTASMLSAPVRFHGDQHQPLGARARLGVDAEIGGDELELARRRTRGVQLGRLCCPVDAALIFAKN